MMGTYYTTYKDHSGFTPYHRCLVLANWLLDNGAAIQGLLDLTQLHGVRLKNALAKLPPKLRRKKVSALRRYDRHSE